MKELKVIAKEVQDFFLNKLKELANLETAVVQKYHEIQGAKMAAETHLREVSGILTPGEPAKSENPIYDADAIKKTSINTPAANENNANDTTAAVSANTGTNDTLVGGQPGEIQNASAGTIGQAVNNSIADASQNAESGQALGAQAETTTENTGN